MHEKIPLSLQCMKKFFRLYFQVDLYEFFMRVMMRNSKENEHELKKKNIDINYSCLLFSIVN